MPIYTKLFVEIHHDLLAARHAHNAFWSDVARKFGAFGHRAFGHSPAHYTDILAQFDVQAITRCNAPQI
jgi:hypothetical protein